MTFSLWSELMDDNAVEAALGSLAKAGLGIGLSLPSARLGDKSFARLTRSADRAGVPVRVWPLLPEAHGYWIGETNVAEADELMRALVSWRERRGGPVFAGISFDLEPDLAYSERLRRLARARPDKVLGLLLEHVRPTAFAKARSSLARTVARLRRSGLHVHAVTYPLILDQPEHDTTLEDALAIPVSGIDWDELSFMVYQTPFAQLLGTWLGPALVHSYAETAVARFGDRAGIDVGIVGPHGIGIDPGNRYADRSALCDDLGAALAAGIPAARTRIYGLAGVLDSGGLEHWLGAAPVSQVPESSRAVAGFRNLVRGLAVGLRVAS